MDPIINTFKQRLTDPAAKDQVRYGLFVSLADPVAAEIAAASDMDWLIIDTEHAPNDLRTTLVQLQATEAYGPDIVVRPQEGNRALVKRLLDIGAQTLLVPMVDTAEEAAEVVAWTRYPPRGLRGVASARAARWGRVDGYFDTADDQVCVIAQIESQEGIQNLDAICAVDGVDVLFVGPSDLAADMGHLGDSSHPEVQDAVLETLQRISANGKPAGVYAATPETAERYAAAGATLVIVGVDTMVLSGAFAQLTARFKG
ncbi:MAG: HpcH/HpaI aldolase/citrate lyase family protein [Actinomycetota bacterium]